MQNLLDSGFLSSRKGEHPRYNAFKGGGRGAGLHDIIIENSNHAHETALINAMMVAGLYPNIAAMRCNPRRPPDCFTNEDGKVSIHPSSLLGSVFGDKHTCAPLLFRLTTWCHGMPCCSTCACFSECSGFSRAVLLVGRTRGSWAAQQRKFVLGNMQSVSSSDTCDMHIASALLMFMVRCAGNFSLCTQTKCLQRSST